MTLVSAAPPEAIAGRYLIYGISCTSPFPLPFPNTDLPPEITVAAGSVPMEGSLVAESDDPVPYRCLHRNGTVTLEYDGDRFAMTADRLVIDAVKPARALDLLHNTILGLLLTTREIEAFHASVVGRGDRALAVFGESGAGKSTSATRLVDRGWALITDDLLVIDGAGRAMPGPTHLRLRPDQAAGRAGVWDAGGKLRYEAAAAQGPAPLTTVLFLDEQFDCLTSIRGSDAVDLLLRHFIHDLIVAPGQSRRRLDLAVAIATRVTCWGAPPRSMSADDLERLAEAAAVVDGDEFNTARRTPPPATA